MNNIISEELIILDYDADNQIQVIEDVAEKMFEMDKLTDKQQYIDSVIEREKEFSTCFDFEVAIPHGKTDAVQEPCFAFIRLKNKIQWCENNENLAKLVFMIAVPESDKENTHLKILAQLSRNLMHDDFREKLSNLTDKAEILELFNEIL